MGRDTLANFTHACVCVAGPKEKSKSQLSALQQECTLLKSQIVESPEALKQTIQDMTLQVHTERDQVTGFEKKARDLQVKIDALTQLEQVRKAPWEVARRICDAVFPTRISSGVLN